MYTIRNDTFLLCLDGHRQPEGGGVHKIEHEEW
jgi:hypothetical protein